MLTAIFALTICAVMIGLVLGYVSVRFSINDTRIVDSIKATLPQMQCKQCGYANCRLYAEAVVMMEAEIDKCIPGGDDTYIALADLLGRDISTFTAAPMPYHQAVKAVIDEQTCIGCTLCLQACPVDAIVGASKHLHQVIASECTGCTLCIPTCPVECIQAVPIPQTIANWRWPFP